MKTTNYTNFTNGEMRDGWKRVKLGEVAEYVTERWPASALSKQTYVSTENMLPDKGGIKEAASIPETGSVTAYKIGDTLVSNIRPYFKKLWFASVDGGCSNDVLVFRGNSDVDRGWLRWLLSQDCFFDHCMLGANGCKMPRGNKAQIMQFELTLPPLPTQRAIAAVLGALDDKIELNRKMNANLEAQAQALFKSWFVDFEPWGGKMPEGWKKGTLGELITETLSGDWGKDSPEGSNQAPVYCIRGADIPDVINGSKGKMPLRYILPKNYEKKRLADSDIVVELSGGSPTQSTGRAAWITESLLKRYDRGMVCTNFCKALKPKEGFAAYVYYLWRYLYDKGVFFGYENGTTGIKNLAVGDVIENEEVVIPTCEAALEYMTKVEKYKALISRNGNESEKLAELRDALLPKLMSGELEVK